MRQTGRDRKASIRTRLERLEALRAKTELSREAWIVTDPSDTAAEHHLVLVSPANARRCQFEQRPGPGPQLADFGEFDMFIELSSDEMKI
jgi:hypothetical protein